MSAGSEMSPAGLTVGARALGLHTRVVSVSPIVYPEPRADEIARIANAIAERLGIDARFAPADILVDDSYIGEAYGIVSDAGREALNLLATLEGIILDPVYTSKCMAGLIDHVRRGLLVEGRDGRVRPHGRAAGALRLCRRPAARAAGRRLR